MTNGIIKMHELLERCWASRTTRTAKPVSSQGLEMFPPTSSWTTSSARARRKTSWIVSTHPQKAMTAMNMKELE